MKVLILERGFFALRNLVLAIALCNLCVIYKCSFFLVTSSHFLSFQCLYSLDDHVNRVYTLLFDGDYIISGSLDTTIRVYNFHTGRLVQTLYGHQSLTSGMVLRKNQLISSNADGTVRVWDILTGESSRILSGEPPSADF